MYFLNSYFSRKTIRKLRRERYEKADRELIAANSSAKILVVLHLFYPQSWKEIKEYLLNLRP